MRRRSGRGQVAAGHGRSRPPADGTWWGPRARTRRDRRRCGAALRIEARLTHSLLEALLGGLCSAFLLFLVVFLRFFSSPLLFSSLLFSCYKTLASALRVVARQRGTSTGSHKRAEALKGSLQGAWAVRGLAGVGPVACHAQ